MLLELPLEALHEREGIGGASRKADQDALVIAALNLAGIALHDGVPK